MHRFFINPIDPKHDHALLSVDQAKHAYKVLRLKNNDPVVLLDGQGNKYNGYLEHIDKKTGIVKVKNHLHEKKQKPAVTLAAAIPKQSKFEAIVDKATQLGVDTIIPVITERTVVKTYKDKTERWQKVAVEACKQCGCSYLPKVGPIHDFEQIAKNASKFDLAVIAALDVKTVPLKKVLSGKKPGDCLVMIGPEGDFTEQEVNLAKLNKTAVVSLGKNVLRCETAVTMILSVINYEWKK
jgi:16S rRNA (uracil1498-N3)-methyltransferase